MKTLSVNKLAEATGKSPHTIRGFNRRIGIPGGIKGEGGRWSFSESAIEWVKSRKPGNPNIKTLRNETLSKKSINNVTIIS